MQYRESALNPQWKMQHITFSGKSFLRNDQPSAIAQSAGGVEYTDCIPAAG